MTEKPRVGVWHVKPARQNGEYVWFAFCGRKASDAEPYFMSIESIIRYRENLTICEECWRAMTEGIMTGPEEKDNG